MVLVSERTNLQHINGFSLSGGGTFDRSNYIHVILVSRYCNLLVVDGMEISLLRRRGLESDPHDEQKHAGCCMNHSEERGLEGRERMADGSTSHLRSGIGDEGLSAVWRPLNRFSPGVVVFVVVFISGCFLLFLHPP